MPAGWVHPYRPPTGQYRIALVWTGDDLGPDQIVWLVEHQLTQYGAIAFVDDLNRIGEDRRAHDE